MRYQSQWPWAMKIIPIDIEHLNAVPISWRVVLCDIYIILVHIDDAILADTGGENIIAEQNLWGLFQ